MKMSTARTAAIAGLAMAALALAACSTSTGTDAGDGTTITIVSSTSEPEQAVIDLFERKNPEIHVKTTTAPAATYSQVVATQLGGGTAADVIRAYPGNGANISVVQATNKGLFAPLSDLSFTKTLPSSLKPILESKKGAVSAVPVTTSAIGGVYNQTLLDQLGIQVPTTWDEMLQYCADVTAAGKIPYGLGLKDAWTGQFVPYALAATLLPADFAARQEAGKATFASSPWRTVFDKYMQMKDAGCFTPQPNGTSYANVEDSIAQGDTAASITLSLTIADIQKTAPSGTKLTFAPVPATNDASETRLSDGVGVVFALNARSKHPDAAKKLLDFFATPDAQAAYSKAAGTSPALAASSDFTPDAASTTIAAYTEKNMVSAWPDQTWPNPNVQQAHFDGVQGLFAGTTTVEGVLEAMDKAYRG